MMNLNWKILTPMALFTFMFTAIANKLLPAGNNLIRIGGLLAMNLVIWFITNWALSRFISNQPRPVVTGARPVAIGEKPTVIKEEPSA